MLCYTFAAIRKRGRMYSLSIIAGNNENNFMRVYDEQLKTITDGSQKKKLPSTWSLRWKMGWKTQQQHRTSSRCLPVQYQICNLIEHQTSFLPTKFSLKTRNQEKHGQTWCSCLRRQNETATKFTRKKIPIAHHETIDEKPIRNSETAQ